MNSDMIFSVSERHRLPDPWYVDYLKEKRVFFDVGTLLRGLLFKDSHSYAIINAIKWSSKSKIIISSHVRKISLQLLNKINKPLIPEFTSELLYYIKFDIINIVEDGDLDLVPERNRFDPADDDIVLASALSSNCDILFTLDKILAEHASELIETRSPTENGINYFYTPTKMDEIHFFNGPNTGSITFQIEPLAGSTSYKSDGRRFVFCSDTGFACWLSEKTWQYEVGFISKRPFIIFPKIDVSEKTLISVSYDNKTSTIVGGMKHINSPSSFAIKVHKPPLGNIGQRWWLLCENNGTNQYSGYFQGMITTADFIGKKGIKYLLKNKRHFEVIDTQRFPLEDNRMSLCLSLQYEKNIFLN